MHNHFYKFIYLVLILFWALQLNATVQNKINLDQQRPDNVSDKKWSSLKAAIFENKLLDVPTGRSGEASQFGQSVSVDGNRALVGGLNMGGGSVIVLDFNGNVWTKSAVLISSDTIQTDRFGYAVSLLGTRALVGAYVDRANNISSGSAYIFDFIGNNWVETAHLIPSDGTSSKDFGWSVSLSVDRALVGDYMNSHSGTVSGGGAAYVYDYDGNQWTESAKLIAGDAAVNDNFASAISLSGNMALIGAYKDDDNGTESGSAYLFKFDGSSWSQMSKITASDGAASDLFGWSVSLSGNRALIGAHQNNSAGTNSGAAYVFDYDGTNWSETIKLTATVGAQSDYFGYSVSLVGNRALIGAILTDEFGNASGSAYVFDYINSTWTQSHKLTASDGAANDRFGTAVSLSTDIMLIGVPLNDDLGTSSGAAYAFSLNGNNWIQAVKIVEQGTAKDYFGYSVSISGNRALIGSYGDDENGNDSGSATIYEYNGTSWVYKTKLLPSDGAVNDKFGFSVSLLGTRAMIGAYLDDDGFTSSGSVYVFDFDGFNWQQSYKINASDATVGDFFGYSVSLSINRALIGARNDDENGTGSGSAYVFDYNGITWVESIKLIGSDTDASDRFGSAVSLSGGRALIGAELKDQNGLNSGAAYVFDYDGATWSETSKLLSSDIASGDKFGISVGLSGDRAVIGASQHRDNGGNSGSAYVFEYDGNTWSQSAKLLATDGGTNDYFGISVSISGDIIAVGSYKDDDVALDSGAVYVYQLDGVNWIQSKFVASDGQYMDLFGTSVSLSGSRILIGASEDNNNGLDAGSAYVINLAPTYSISGVVSGMATNNSLVLQNNLAFDLSVTSNGPFIFPTALNTGDSYNITVSTPPTTPNQVCVVANGNGTIGQVHITDVTVTCSTNTYTVGGGVTGLVGSITLGNEGSTLTFSDSDPQTFTFPAQDDGSAYAVTVVTQPDFQTCTVSNGSGDLNGGDITTVAVNCTTDTFTVGGQITGLLGSLSITNAGNNLTISDSDSQSFVFPAQNDGTAYAVTVDTNPSIQICVVTGGGVNNTGSGVLAGISINDVLITCTTNQYRIGGVLSGLGASPVTLVNNGGDDLILNANGSFEFTTLLDDLSNYNVSVKDNPTSPNQTCVVTNNSGTLAGSDISSVVVNCNTAPVVVTDNYSVDINTTLVANDIDGTATTSTNDDGVLANDSDAESDSLSIAVIGGSTAGGIGGSITIVSVGSFIYVPPTDVSGQATFSYEVTDGISTVPAVLTIDVIGINDAPSFSILGDVDASPIINTQNTSLQIPSFVFDIVFGPSDESNQMVKQFNVNIISDSNNILNNISVTNSGTLNADFSLNYGTALLGLNLQDNGGTANGGMDTSATVEFSITYTNFIFADSFEDIVNMKLSDYLKSSDTEDLYPTYENNGLIFYNHKFKLNSNFKNSNYTEVLKSWLNEVLIYEGDFGS